MSESNSTHTADAVMSVVEVLSQAVVDIIPSVIVIQTIDVVVQDVILTQPSMVLAEIVQVMIRQTAIEILVMIRQECRISNVMIGQVILQPLMVVQTLAQRVVI